MPEKLSDIEIQNNLKTLQDWELKDNALIRTFQLPSFAHAVLMVGAIGQQAEAAGHHPDILIHGYNKLTVTLTTHSAGGITEKDFSLARQIQALPLRQKA